MPSPLRNLDGRIFLTLLCIAVTILAGCATDTAPPRERPDAEAIRSFLALQTRGYEALAGDSLDAALGHFAELRTLIPDSPLGHYHRACALGRVGRIDEAVAEMRSSIEQGFSHLVRAENDPDLAGVRASAAWDDLVAAMHAELADQRRQLQETLRELPFEQEPSFPDLDSLRGYYGPRYRDAAWLMQVYPEPVAAAEACGVLNHKLAGLERHRAENEEESIRHDVDLELLTSLTDLPDMDARPWIVGRDLCGRYADRILQLYPDSSGAALAALWKIRCDWYGRQTGAVAEAPPAELRTLAERLAEMAAQYPGAPAGAEALAEAIVLQSHADPDDPAAVRPLVDALRANPAYAREHLGRFAYDATEQILLAGGPPEFVATDIDGRQWSLAGLRGSVVLLDFWATWCGPCRAEIPTLVGLQERFGGRGLRILGISLDSSDGLSPETFRSWIAEHEMSWPQIYTGDGWQSALAELYKVPAIPFPVLIDRRGVVVAAGASARGEQLAEQIAELLEH